MKLEGNNTIVTANGRVLYTPTAAVSQGLVIVDEAEGKPILTMSEVSDEETVNLFLYPAADNTAISGDEDEEGMVLFHDSTLEILVQRANLRMND